MSLPGDTDYPEPKSFCTFHEGRCKHENRPCPHGYIPVSFNYLPVVPIKYIKCTIHLTE